MQPSTSQGGVYVRDEQTRRARSRSRSRGRRSHRRRLVLQKKMGGGRLCSNWLSNGNYLNPNVSFSHHSSDTSSTSRSRSRSRGHRRRRSRTRSRSRDRGSRRSRRSRSSSRSRKDRKRSKRSKSSRRHEKRHKTPSSSHGTAQKQARGGKGDAGWIQPDFQTPVQGAQAPQGAPNGWFTKTSKEFTCKYTLYLPFQ